MVVRSGRTKRKNKALPIIKEYAGIADCRVSRVYPVGLLPLYYTNPSAAVFVSSLYNVMCVVF